MLKQKKTLIALPVVILTLLLLAGTAYGEEIKTGVINADTVNMRESPAANAKVLIQLPKEAKITVADKQGDWYKISYNDSQGFVFGKYVTLKDAVIDSGTINGANVNVRSKPDKSSEILTKLDKGAKLEIYEYSDNWARIGISEGRSGWVYEDFITVKKVSGSRGETAEPVKTDEQVNNNTEEDIRQQIVGYARKFLGVKYVYGGSSSKGFDCSGFTSYVFKHFGISLERTSTSQGSHGVKINRSDLKPGDLVFFDTNGGLNAINHVGMYVGEGKFIHASSGSTNKVIISDMTEGFYYKNYMRSRRYIED
ncbi:MAG: hypothetical protein FIA99_06680 [Ruminiclostridium sp.]|nr:hypothetical protein [Ruminiclostridium sp.]